MGPQSFADLGWWVLGGAIFVSVSSCALLLRLLLGKLDTICKKLDYFQRAMNRQDKVIVEIQTRCAMNHGVPTINHVPMGEVE
jgi:hypothetical protein